MKTPLPLYLKEGILGQIATKFEFEERW